MGLTMGHPEWPASALADKYTAPCGRVPAALYNWPTLFPTLPRLTITSTFALVPQQRQLSPGCSACLLISSSFRLGIEEGFSLIMATSSERSRSVSLLTLSGKNLCGNGVWILATIWSGYAITRSGCSPTRRDGTSVSSYNTWAAVRILPRGRKPDPLKMGAPAPTTAYIATSDLCTCFTTICVSMSSHRKFSVCLLFKRKACCGFARLIIFFTTTCSNLCLMQVGHSLSPFVLLAGKMAKLYNLLNCHLAHILSFFECTPCNQFSLYTINIPRLSTWKLETTNYRDPHTEIS